MYWLFGHKSKLSVTNSSSTKLYSNQSGPTEYDWGTASMPNIEILERFQPKALRTITDAPWYLPNTVIWKDLQIPTIKHEISRYSYHYSKHFSMHPNELTNFLYTWQKLWDVKFSAE
jgi:hypothetical protein